MAVKSTLLSLNLTLTVLSGSFGALPAQADEALVMGAVGDSITLAVNAVEFGNNPVLSWSTGTAADVQSHWSRLQTMTGRTVLAFNEAVSGSRAGDLLGQVMRLEERHPSYVTIATGANDVCSWDTDSADQLIAFESAVRAAVARLIEHNPSIQLVLAPIPNLYNLWEVSHNRNSCQVKWDLFGICSPLLSGQRSALERQQFVNRWQAANDKLAQIADEFSEHVRFNPDLAATQFTSEHVSSLDCFHPSAAGQKLFSQKTWENGWYASDVAE